MEKGMRTQKTIKKESQVSYKVIKVRAGVAEDQAATAGIAQRKMISPEINGTTEQGLCIIRNA